MPKTVKHRHWEGVLYPESMTANWDDYIDQSGLACALSPLHDRDVDPTTGELKKPHYHLLMCWDGPTTLAAATSFIKELGGVLGKRVMSVGGFYAYLTHARQAHKVQYDVAGIRHFGAFDPANYDMEYKESEEQRRRDAVLDYIISNNLYEYADLLERLRADERGYELRVTAMTQAVVYRSYLNSRRNRQREGGKGAQA